MIEEGEASLRLLFVLEEEQPIESRFGLDVTTNFRCILIGTCRLIFELVEIAYLPEYQIDRETLTYVNGIVYKSTGPKVLTFYQ